MPNLPEDILDRIRTLERQVQKLTTYMNSKPGAAGTIITTAAPTDTGDVTASDPADQPSGGGGGGADVADR